MDKYRVRQILWACLFLTVQNVFPVAAEEFSGKVVSVADGDTLTILVDQKQIKIRLAGIDAPESKQPFGTVAKKRLGELVHEKEVIVKASGADRYGRTLGVVYAGETNVNEILVSEGLAWHYKRYSKDERLSGLEREAREAKRGLWVDKMPVAPWEWRKKSKSDQSLF